MSKLATAPLGDLILDAQSGFASGAKAEDGIAQIRMNNITLDGSLDMSSIRRVPQDAVSNVEKYLLRDGDILFNATNSPNLVGKTARFIDQGEPFAFSNHFVRLVVNPDKLDSSYLARWLTLQQQRGVFELLCTRWVNQASVRKEDLLSQNIPLPPLAEQKRIAAILDQADALRAKRRAALARLDALVQSVFLAMFGDPVTNPMGWAVVHLGKIADFIGGGTPSREVPEYFEGNICWATSKDMKGEILYDTEEHITQQAIDNSATKLLSPGNLLVVVKSKILMRRLPVLINHVATCFGQDLKGIVPKNGLSPRYLARHIRLGERLLLQRARGVNTEGLTLDHLRSYPVMMPPKNQIEDFNQQECLIMSQIQKAQQELQKLDDLFHSLQQRAFREEL